jgi:4'-phosphopantetheinyl transferase EntD
VVVAKKSEINSVGLDVELIGRLKRQSWMQVCTPQEAAWIDSMSPSDQELNVALIFSAKECVYKCQYQLTRQWLEFHDVLITPDHSAGEFEARFLKGDDDQHGGRRLLRGKFLFSRGLVCTGLTVRHPDEN